MSYDFKQHLRELLIEQKKAKGLLKEQDYKVYKTQKGDTMRSLFGLGASFDRKDPLGRYNFTNVSLALRDAGAPRHLRDEEAKLDHPLGTDFKIRLPMTSKVPDTKPKEEEKSYKGRGFPEAEDEYLDLVNRYDEATTGDTAFAKAARDKRPVFRAIVAQTAPVSYMKKMSGEGKWLWKSLQDPKKYGDSIKIGFITGPGGPLTGQAFTGEPADEKIYLYPIIIRNKQPVVWTVNREIPLIKVPGVKATKIHPIAY